MSKEHNDDNNNNNLSDASANVLASATDLPGAPLSDVPDQRALCPLGRRQHAVIRAAVWNQGGWRQ